MAGTPGKSGGARVGAGRKPNPPVPPAVTGERDPLKFLESVLCGTITASPEQIKAAVAMLPFKYQKLGDSGKKEQKQEAAEKAATGKFGLRAVK